MEQFIDVLRELKRGGIENSWLVGGVVRDFLLGREPSDVDVVCEEASAETVVAKLGGVMVGKPPFCTVSTAVLGIPVEVALLTGGSIQKDLARRDFTVNALAMDCGGSVIDPFSGARDVRNHVLRLVPAAASPYDADSVRVVRLLRLACSLGFSIDPDTESVTKKFISERGAELAAVPKERYGKEFVKGFASRPYDFLTLLEDYSLLPTTLPEVETMRGVEQPLAFHPEGDVLKHTFRVLAEAQKTIEDHPGGQDVLLALSALFHDVGKPQTARPHPKYGHTCFFGHEEVGERLTLDTLNAWAVPAKTASRAAALVRHHMIPGGNFTERTGVKLLRRLGEELTETLFDLALCDAKGATGTGENIMAARNLFFQVRDNLCRAASFKRWLNGRDVMETLGIPPGPQVGRILEELDVAVGKGELNSREEAIVWLTKGHARL
ncbi:MAG: HD domain-containing protein [Synergistaceae bacterium]|jgi:putative nucleotidyltransferase with HDIG domain|nr:HD domain-containing protein [Synergistaceae bacterium]